MDDHQSLSTNQLAEELIVVVNRFTVLLRGELRDAGVTLPQARTLSSLYGHEPRRVTELARSEQVSQPAMTSLVNTLEERGLVSRRTADSDRRAVEVSLTDAGRQLMQTIQAARAANVRQRLAELAPDDVATLEDGASALGRLNEAIRASRRVSRVNDREGARRR